MRDLIQAFRGQMRRLVGTGDRVLVAVSGGADSVALLDLAVRAAESLSIEPVVVHVDHGWRPDSADDASFVAQLAADRDLRCVSERAQDLSTSEAAGRAARLSFFARAASATSATGVLLGHTLDDQSETVLMHLLRGSGLDGALGLRAESLIDVAGARVRLLRPLLGFRRAHLRAYCEHRRLHFRDDRSNLDLQYLRNRIRAELLPTLERIAPGGIEALARLGETAAPDLELLDKLADVAWWELARSALHEVRLDRSAFRAQPLALQRRVLRRVGADLIGPAPDLPLERVEAARLALIGRRGGTVIEWPGRVTLRVIGRHGIFSRGAL